MKKADRAARIVPAYPESDRKDDEQEKNRRLAGPWNAFDDGEQRWHCSPMTSLPIDWLREQP